ncbi:hypothetical protein AB4Z48_18540 [Cupriavidus sp. 2TAF22]|uniref:hypothetical protein n=1 Tax=unclassified Cupriavidus TaxID=2640874 RepID=UPI003F8DFB83
MGFATEEAPKAPQFCLTLCAVGAGPKLGFGLMGVFNLARGSLDLADAHRCAALTGGPGSFTLGVAGPAALLMPAGLPMEQLAPRHPYGRARLDQLLAATQGTVMPARGVDAARPSALVLALGAALAAISGALTAPVEGHQFFANRNLPGVLDPGNTTALYAALVAVLLVMWIATRMTNARFSVSRCKALVIASVG